MFIDTLQGLDESTSGFRFLGGILLANHRAEPCRLPNMHDSVSKALVNSET